MLMAAVGLVAVIAAVVLADSGGRHASGPPRRTAPLAAPGPSPTTAPDTVLLTCDSANGGPLGPHWRARSLQAGPLWFVYGRQQGYVHYSGWHAAARGRSRSGNRRIGVMIIEVAPGSTVVMRAAPAARPYFHFVDGFGSVSATKQAEGEPGFTLVACPRGSGGPSGQVTDFYLGFSIVAGRTAPVEVWSSADSRPIQVIFTCPGHGCEGR